MSEKKQRCHRHQEAWKHLNVGDVQKVDTETLVEINLDIRKAVDYLSGRLPESYLMWVQSSRDAQKIEEILLARGALKRVWDAPVHTKDPS